MAGKPAGSATSDGPGHGAPRIAVLDAVRGLAVLAMLEWHTADAWLADGERGGPAFVALRAVGGLAAPFFLILAGVSLGLATPLRPGPAETIASAKRGLRIVVAGYALSSFSWIVDHGAPLDPRNLGTVIATVAAIACAALALDERARSEGERAALAACALGGGALVAARLDGATHAAATLLPRLDVLHGIGAAIVVTAIVLHASRALAPARRVLVLGAIAALVAASALAIEGAPQRALPTSIAAWIARDASRRGGFPLFPWLAYSLVGAALALHLRARSLRLAHAWALPCAVRPGRLVIAALAILALAWDYSPLARSLLESIEALRSLARLVANTALAVMTAASLTALAPLAPRAVAALAMLGRHSLVLYAAHLELAYGLVGIPLRNRFLLGAWLPALALVVVAMYALASAIERHARVRREHVPRRVEAIG